MNEILFRIWKISNFLFFVISWENNYFYLFWICIIVICAARRLVWDRRFWLTIMTRVLRLRWPLIKTVLIWYFLKLCFLKTEIWDNWSACFQFYLEEYFELHHFRSTRDPFLIRLWKTKNLFVVTFLWQNSTAVHRRCLVIFLSWAGNYSVFRSSVFLNFELQTFFQPARLAWGLI